MLISVFYERVFTMFIDKFNKAKKFVETTLTERISESIRKGVDELLNLFVNDINTLLILNEPAIIKLTFICIDDNIDVHVKLISSYSDESHRFSVDVSDIEKDICFYRIIPNILSNDFINKIAVGAIMNKFSGANICRLNHEEFYKYDNKDYNEYAKHCVKYLIGTPEMSLADLLFANLTPKK